MALISTDNLVWRATSHGTPCLYKEDVEEAVKKTKAQLELVEKNMRSATAEELSSVHQYIDSICVEAKDNNFFDYIKEELPWQRTCDEYTYWYRCPYCGVKPPYNEWKQIYFSPYCPECGRPVKYPTGCDSN